MGSGDPIYPKDPGGSLIDDTAYLDRGASVPASSNGESSTGYNQRSILDYDGNLATAMDIFRTAIDKDDTATIDKIVNWWRDDQLRKEQYDREDHAYSRLATDLRSIGINPIALLQGASPISNGFQSSSSGSSNYSTARSQNESARHNKQEEQTKILTAIMTVLGTILMATAVAL